MNLNIKLVISIFSIFLFANCSANNSEENKDISPKQKATKHRIETTILVETDNLQPDSIQAKSAKLNEVSIDEIDTDINTISSIDNTVIETTEETLVEIIEEVIEEPKLTPEPLNTFQDYSELSAFLKSHVSSTGKVNYSKIKTNISQLNSIIKSFENNYPNSDWSRNEVLVYWINAYNVYTLKLVASNYPVSSIKDITAKPWHKKFINLGGSTLSLNDIEHTKIRGHYNEPRIHFALNCASESCPVLMNKAFTTKSLYSQLTVQTKRFLNDPSKNNFSDAKNIKLSSLFDWYKDDFIKKEGSVIDFINKYRSDQLSSPNIKYMEYSWKLNN